jgi:signal transduction histidine kinase/ligand-binding sensor domain-containing protein
MSANTKLIVLPDDRVFYCRDDSLYVIVPDSSPRALAINLSMPEVITCLAAGHDGEVFVGSSGGSIFRVRDGRPVQHKLSHGRIYDLMEDVQGDLWVRVQDGLAKIRKENLEHERDGDYAFANKIEVNYLGPMLQDRENNLWVGTASQGLMKLADRSLLRFPLSSEAALLAAADSSGHIWVSARDELLEFFRDEKGRWRKFAHHLDDPDSAFSYLPMLVDNFSRLWIWKPLRRELRAYAVTSRRGLSSRLSLIKKIVQGRHIHENPLVSFYVDRKNRLWCGMDYVDVEVVDLDHIRTVAVYGKGDAAPGHSIRAIYEDREGNIWLGDHHDGLSVLFADGKRPYTFKKFTTTDGLPDNGVRSIHQDRDGKIWIGTRHGGLALYENGAFRSVSMKQGLRSNAVWWIGDDDRGRLWLDTDAGIELVNRSTLQPFLPKSLLAAEGVRSAVCGLYGDEFFWSVDAAGLNIYEYTRDTIDSIPPPIYLKRVQVNGEMMPIRDKIELSHLQNNCTIEYAGISLRDEKAVQYQYRLEGIDADWGAPTARREVAYAALRPGNYHFEVVAINGDGVKSAEPAELRFIIHPPLWERWWFVAGVALAIAGSLGGIVRYASIQKLKRRVQALEREQAILQEREQTRDRIARDLHDDVASTLGSIALYVETLKRQLRKAVPEAQAAMEKINNLALAAEEAMGDIIWSVSPQHDTLPDLLTRMRDIGMELCSTHRIDSDFHLPENLEPIRLADELRKNLYLIFKEGITNAVKHAQAKSITVEAKMSDGMFEMTIVDDGRGFAETREFTSSLPVRGHGLRNMKKRADEIGAEFLLQSTPGKGTAISLSFKMA